GAVALVGRRGGFAPIGARGGAIVEAPVAIAVDATGAFEAPTVSTVGGAVVVVRELVGHEGGTACGKQEKGCRNEWSLHAMLRNAGQFGGSWDATDGIRGGVFCRLLGRRR